MSDLSALGDLGDGFKRLAVAQLADPGAFSHSFALRSAAFDNGGELDPCFTADEEDAVAPPLEWNTPPAGTQELVIIAEDADSAGPDLTCHWIVWGFPGQKGKLMEGETPPRAGKNSRGNSEYLLPAPPQEDDAHRYVFQIFALDAPLGLTSGAKKDDVIAAMRGHVLAASVLVATYKRADDDDFDDDFDDEYE